MKGGRGCQGCQATFSAFHTVLTQAPGKIITLTEGVPKNSTDYAGKGGVGGKAAETRTMPNVAFEGGDHANFAAAA